jgi:hypothetical protein
MNKLQLSTLIAAISLTGGIYANAQTTGGQTSATPGTTNPMPATNPAEGTAADSTPPGKTPVRGTAASQAPDQATAQGQQNSDDTDSMTQGADNAIPATGRAEGTAADTTAPGETPVRGAAASQASEQATDQGSESQSQQSTGSPTSSSESTRTRTAEGTPDRPWQAPKSGTEDSTQTEADSTQTDSGTQGE